MKGARKARAMRDIEKGLRMLTTGLRRLALDLSAVGNSPSIPVARRRPVTRALRLQGRYMGLIRNLPARKKQRVMAARASLGVERAIRMARELKT
jgi:hypothetical protein